MLGEREGERPSQSTDFPDTEQGECLRLLDVSLRCSICYGIYDTPLMLRGCGHTFCASCIRGSLDFQEKAGQPACPGCRHPCDARDLLPCHSLREAADRYRRARGAILDLLRPVPPPRASSAELEGAPAPPPAAAPGPPPPAPQRMRTRSSSKSSEAEAGPGSRGSDGTASPSASSSSSGSEWDVDPAAASEADSSPAKGGRSGGQVPCKRQRTGAGGGSDEVGCVTGSDPEHSRNPGLGGPSPPESDPPKGFVACPICARRVPAFYINSHVDACLARGAGPGDGPGGGGAGDGTRLPAWKGRSFSAAPQEDPLGPQGGRDAPAAPSTAATGPLPLPPKLVPGLVSDKALRAMLKRVGLPLDGRRADLVARYGRLRREVEVSNDRGERATYARLARRVVAAERQVAAATLLQGGGGEGGGGAAPRVLAPAVVDLVGAGPAAPREAVADAGEDEDAAAWRELVEATRRRDEARRALRAAGGRDDARAVDPGDPDGGVVGGGRGGDVDDGAAPRAAPVANPSPQPAPADQHSSGSPPTDENETGKEAGQPCSQPLSCGAELAGSGHAGEGQPLTPLLTQPRTEASHG
ncbi:hypothetical protein ACKKBG_A11880 [Auxenochlorella protothecoides x Auxenochlorella symbiontica]